MSIAEQWTGKSIKWIPIVASLLLASGVAFLSHVMFVGFYCLYIVLGLPIFEIISIKTTKLTLSQNLILWPSSSIRDYILYFTFCILMISTMAFLYNPFIPTIICLALASAILFWRKHYWMGAYNTWIVLGIPLFELISHGKLTSSLIAWVSSPMFSVWYILMISSMVFLCFHTWREYNEAKK